MNGNGGDKERRELEERLRVGAERLQEMKDNKEFFDVSLEMVNWLLDDLEETGLPGPDECEEAYKEAGRVLEWLHGYIKDALDLAIPFTTPDGEAALRQALDKAGNLRIQVWELQKAVRQEREAEAAQISTGRCPPRFVNGMGSMLSPDAVEFCLTCKYRAKCDDDRKQEYNLALTS